MDLFSSHHACKMTRAITKKKNQKIKCEKREAYNISIKLTVKRAREKFFFTLTPDTQSDKIEEINSNSIMKE